MCQIDDIGRRLIIQHGCEHELLGELACGDGENTPQGIVFTLVMPRSSRSGQPGVAETTLHPVNIFRSAGTEFLTPPSFFRPYEQHSTARERKTQIRALSASHVIGAGSRLVVHWLTSCSVCE